MDDDVRENPMLTLREDKPQETILKRTETGSTVTTKILTQGEDEYNDGTTINDARAMVSDLQRASIREKVTLLGNLVHALRSPRHRVLLTAAGLIPELCAVILETEQHKHRDACLEFATGCLRNLVSRPECTPMRGYTQFLPDWAGHQELLVACNGLEVLLGVVRLEAGCEHALQGGPRERAVIHALNALEGTVRNGEQDRGSRDHKFASLLIAEGSLVPLVIDCCVKGHSHQIKVTSLSVLAALAMAATPDITAFRGHLLENHLDTLGDGVTDVNPCGLVALTTLI